MLSGFKAVKISVSFILVLAILFCGAMMSVTKEFNSSFSVIPEKPDNSHKTGADTADAAVRLEAPDIIPFAVDIVTIDRNRTVGDIVTMAKLLPHSAFDTTKITRYGASVPSFVPPYAAGSLNADDIADALNTLKMVRYTAGLPYENVRFTDELNNISQHGAVLLAASNQFTHYPNKPADMPQSFFDLGYRGCGEANISAGRTNISTAILAGFIADGGSNNIEIAGHRRWILKPGAGDFGIGYARNTASGISYQGDRISMHVFEGKKYWECESDSYIAWPNAGDFPIQYFTASSNIYTAPPYPWTINLGAAYSAPSRGEVVLTLTRKSDNKVWVFDKNTPQLGNGNMPDNSMHLAVDNDGYGMRKAIVFRPDVTSLGAIATGEVFAVKLTGIKNSAGQPASLEYEIRFFDLNAEMNKQNQNDCRFTVLSSGAPLQGAAITVGGKSANTNENGFAGIRVTNNQTYTYTIEKDGYTTVTGTITLGSSDESITINMTMPSAVTVTNNTLTKQGGAIEGGFDALISNNSQTTGAVVVAAAVYTNSGKLVYIKINICSLTTGNNTVSFNDVYVGGADSGAYLLKIFVWDSLNGMIPVMPPGSFSII